MVLEALKSLPEASAVAALLHAPNNCGETPLHSAARWGKHGTLELLLKAGVNIAQPLDKSIRTQHNEKIAKETEKVQQGHIRNIHCETQALHLAAQWGHLQVFKLLHANGASLSAKDEHGRTSLDIAHHFHRSPIVEYVASCS